MKIKLDHGAFMPEYAHEQDAGMDLHSPVNAVVLPHDSAIIHTGHYTIPLLPVTKKNSSQIIFTGAKCPVCKRGRLARLLPSKKYREYEEAALWCLQRKKPITTPVNVRCLFYMPTLRRVDLVNLLEAACDVLVTAGVLADDNSGIVVSHDGSRVLLDRDKPRTEIYITEAQNEL